MSTPLAPATLNEDPTPRCPPARLAPGHASPQPAREPHAWDGSSPSPKLAIRARSWTNFGDTCATLWGRLFGVPGVKKTGPSKKIVPAAPHFPALRGGVRRPNDARAIDVRSAQSWPLQGSRHPPSARAPAGRGGHTSPPDVAASRRRSRAGSRSERPPIARCRRWRRGPARTKGAMAMHTQADPQAMHAGSMGLQVTLTALP